MKNRNDKLNDANARNIIEQNFENNICVEAGAGSGKTFEMVERIFNGLKNKKFQIDKIVVITFTKKATAEMKSRIIEKIKSEIDDKKTEISEYLKEQLLKINSARISTIHSFCQSILKERPVEAGIDPFFEVLEDASEIFQQSMNEFIEKYLISVPKRDDSLHNSIQEILTELIMETDYTLLNKGTFHEKSIENLLRIFVYHRDSEICEPAEYKVKDVKNELNSLIREYKEIFRPDAKLTDFIKQFEQDFNSVDISDIEAIENLNYKTRAGKTDFKEHKNEWKQRCETLIEKLIYAVKYPELKNRIANLKILSEEFIRIYDDNMTEKSKIDLVDLLLKTRDILKYNRQIREYYKNRYTNYFIDEFQDTDPLQSEIICYLCEKENQFADNWENLELKQGKLFIIGDPKQSIFRFRRADIEIYTKIVNKINNKVELTTNFRSNAGILNFVNSVFDERIKKEGDYQPEYKALNLSPQKIQSEKNGKIIAVKSKKYIEQLSGDEKKPNVHTIRTEEANLTASWLLKNKNKLFDKWQDVTILFKQYNILSYLQEIFDEVNIPYTVSGGKSYFARYEIKSLLSLMKAIADPTDSISIMAVLKGPFMGYSDKEIWNWYKSKNESDKIFNPFNYRIYIDEPKSEIEKSLKLIQKFHYRAYRSNPVDIIFEIVNSSDFTAAIAAGYKGNERLQNLIKAIEFLRSINENNYFDLVDRFEEAVVNNIEMGDLDLSAQTEDAVKMMTIYKAKGLENKIVYLADSCSTDIKINKLFVLNNYLYLDEKNFQSFEYKQILESEKKRNEAESERLRYVTVTRAKEYFVMNMFEGYNDKSFSAQIYTYFTKENQVSEEILDTEKSDAFDPDDSYEKIKLIDNDEINNKKSQWKKSIETSLQNSAKPVFIKQTPSKLKKEEFTNDFKLILDISENNFGTKFIQSEENFQIGTVIHLLLELGENCENKKLSQILKNLKQEFKIELSIENLIELYRKITDSKIYKRSLEAKRIFRELPVKFCDDSGNYYDGIIDLLFEENDGWVLVDYKIIFLCSKEEITQTIKKYEQQLNAYKFALSKLGINIKEMHLVTPQSF